MSVTVKTKNNIGFFPTIYTGSSQLLALASTSTITTNPVGPNTEIVMLYSDTNCWVRFGSSALVNDGISFFMPSGIDRFMGIVPGQKVSAICASSFTSGNFYVTEGI